MVGWGGIWWGGVGWGGMGWDEKGYDVLEGMMILPAMMAEKIGEDMQVEGNCGE